MTLPKLRILVFSRGRGRGHVYPDLAIAEELAKISPELEISFASYATGADTFRSLGKPVFDLELPEANQYIPTLLKAIALIKKTTPACVIAHEEFAALLAARITGTRAIYTSGWFPMPASIAAESVSGCDGAVIFGNPGIFAPPNGMSFKPVYVGPIIRKLKYPADQKISLRKGLGIDPQTRIIAIMPGGWSTEARAPLANTVISALGSLPYASWRCVWLASNDVSNLRDLTKSDSRYEIHRFYDDIDLLYTISDLIITKGTYGTALEASSLGVRTISLSFGLNQVDDILVSSIPSNVSLNAHATNGEILAKYITSAISDRSSIPPPPATKLGAGRAATAILGEIKRVLAI